MTGQPPIRDGSIAIVGMACRFPGAAGVDEFWRNVRDGVDSVRDFTLDELRDLGVDEDVLADPRFVGAAGHLDGLDLFDAAFFGYSPAEAAAVDPQQRLFLETAWTALEHAGYDPHAHDGRTGVFGGGSANKYFLFHLFPDARQSISGRGWDGEDLPVGVSPDSLPPRVAYKLRLNGPSIAVQAACATSLVAVALACDSLCDFRCDTALAGGVSVELPSRLGYRYQEGGMLARDGRCRSYDACATGSVFGSGVGVVVLKRLEDAVAAGDHVYAVVRGWAVNNDGGDRVGYAAPGVSGQAAVVAEAHADAEVDAATIGYVEGHGSGTRLGDPIEVAALTDAFRQTTDATGFCALGSVKTNVGHLDAAAGVAGLIKTALAVESGLIPPSLHFDSPNPEIDFEASPFFVPTTPTPWPLEGIRRAGVSSFGVGGTNAHVVLEQAPLPAPRRTARPRSAEVFLLSARSAAAVDEAAVELRKRLDEGEHDPGDVAWTLAVGRGSFAHRHALVRDRTGATRAFRGTATDEARPVTFMFPGVGDHYVGAGAALYVGEPAFAEALDRCADGLTPVLGFDIRSVLYPEGAAAVSGASGVIDLRKMLGREPKDESELALHQPIVAHPVSFALEYALAVLLRSWGVEPASMIGHSMGEYVAACLAGVFTLDEGLEIVGRRALLITEVDEGAMLAVPLPEADVAAVVGRGVSLSAVNAADLCVLAGEEDAIGEVEAALREQGVVARRLPTTHAFHSDAMQQVRGALEDLFAEAALREPEIPYVSSVSGTWIAPGEATDPRYWGEHLCRTVRFAEGIRTVHAGGRDPVLLEVGPGRTLCTLAAATMPDRAVRAFYTIDPYYGHRPADVSTLDAVAGLWAEGVPVDWPAFYAGREGRRVAAPTYPFERRRFWIERPRAERSIPTAPAPAAEEAATPSGRSPAAGAPPSPPRTDTERVLAEAWADLFGVETVAVDTRFVDLGGHSLLALQLVNRLWEQHGIDLPVPALLEHQTVAAVARVLDEARSGEPGRHSPPAARPSRAPADEDPPLPLERSLHEQIARSLGRAPARDERLSKGELAVVVPELIRVVRRDHDIPLYPNEIVDHPAVADLARYITAEVRRYEEADASRYLAELATPETPLSPPRTAAFVLSSVRSGSTLLRVMLAGHPGLFCPPELHLLSRRTMGERARSEPSPDRDQGLSRALMELRGVSMEAAKAEVDDMTGRDLATPEVLARLVDLAAPRLLVDKSPGNANDVTTLHRIERSFTDARYVVLLRHPNAVVDSVVRNRFVRLMSGGDTDPFDFGELVWTRSYGNILDFVETLPSGRFTTIRYEDLVTQPRETLENVCALLGVEWSDAMLRPYEGQRMRDGLGDPNFLTHDAVDPALGDAWRDVRLPRPLGRATRHLAQALGYETSVPASRGVSS